MPTTYGQDLSTALSGLDSALTVTAGTTQVGSSADLGTVPQPHAVAAQFALTQSGTNDQADLTVKVQFSDDNSAWPDEGEGMVIFGWKADSAGGDLGASNILRFIPNARYFRFVFENGNGTDDFDVDSEYAPIQWQDDT